MMTKRTINPNRDLTTLCGKFDHAIDAIAYEASLDGCDEEHGDVNETGRWHGLLRGWKTDGPMADVSFTARLDNALTECDLLFMREHPAGCIVTENCQGFVAVEWFSDNEDREARWRELTAE